MAIKDIKEFSAEEVGMWLVMQGLGEKAEKFVEEGIDGDLLLSLTAEDFHKDLGLSSLQTKKLLKNIAFTQEIFSKTEAGGEETEDLKGKVKILEREKAALEENVEDLQGKVTDRDAKINELQGLVQALSTNDSRHQPPPQAAPVANHHAPTHHAPAPVPVSNTNQSHHRAGAPVVRNAAVGAAGGAMKGAVIGAILPGMDASDGAAAGAAAGALGGGMRGIGERRRMRR